MERHKALENFGQFYEIIVPLMEEIKMSTSGCNSDAVADARSLHKVNDKWFTLAIGKNSLQLWKTTKQGWCSSR